MSARPAQPDGCWNCRFFLQRTHPTYGWMKLCRRFPPVWIRDGLVGWGEPAVDDQYWCGEHKRSAPGDSNQF